jgi:hypothetical protein
LGTGVPIGILTKVTIYIDALHLTLTCLGQPLILIPP